MRHVLIIIIWGSCNFAWYIIYRNHIFYFPERWQRTEKSKTFFSYLWPPEVAQLLSDFKFYDVDEFCVRIMYQKDIFLNRKDRVKNILFSFFPPSRSLLMIKPIQFPSDVEFFMAYHLMVLYCRIPQNNGTEVEKTNIFLWPLGAL